MQHQKVNRKKAFFQDLSHSRESMQNHQLYTSENIKQVVRNKGYGVKVGPQDKQQPAFGLTPSLRDNNQELDKSSPGLKN